jgi:SsrA-binding protein
VAEINIRNKRATFEFHLEDRFVAGVQLTGTEIKSIRDSKASISEAYCLFRRDELFIKNMHITEYTQGSYNNHDPLRERKLLLKKRELAKLKSKVTERGYTIVPLKLFLSETGWVKIEIALARGKKTHDKRESIKERETKRELDRMMKRR